MLHKFLKIYELFEFLSKDFLENIISNILLIFEILAIAQNMKFSIKGTLMQI